METIKLKSKLERFTNDRNKYLEEIKRELLDYQSEDNYKVLFTYVEMTFFLTYAFSYHCFIKGNEIQIKKKEWNAAYDDARFDKGIYNIDRLAIREGEVQLSKEEQAYLTGMELAEMETIPYGGVVLDGWICELHTKSNEEALKWNIDEEMNDALIVLIQMMRAWKRELNSN